VFCSCNTNKPVYSNIGSFAHSLLPNEDNATWVIESHVFDAFKRRNFDEMWFRVGFGFCFMDFSLCEQVILYLYLKMYK